MTVDTFANYVPLVARAKPQFGAALSWCFIGSFLLIGFQFDAGGAVRIPQLVAVAFAPYLLIRFGVARTPFLFVPLYLAGMLVVKDVMSPFGLVQVVLISVLAYVSFELIRAKGALRIAQIYFYIAAAMAVFGLLQIFFPSLLPKNSGSFGFLRRISSVYNEPSHFSLFLTPAVYFAVHILFTGNRLWLAGRRTRIDVVAAGLVLLAQLVTFSMLGYLGGLLSILFVSAKAPLGRRIFLLAGASVLIPLALTVPFILERATGLGDIDNPSGNLSAFVQYVNLRVTWDAFQQSPVFGSGIGTYQSLYDQFASAYRVGILGLYELNTSDAGSLLLRITAETGLVGIGIVIFIFVRYRVTSAAGAWYHINKAAMIFLVLYLVRLGNYVWPELWLFVALYVVSAIEWRSLRTKSQVATEKTGL